MQQTMPPQPSELGGSKKVLSILESPQALENRIDRLLTDLLARFPFEPQQSRKIAEALSLMCELHSDQERVGGQPYVCHTLLVAVTLLGKFRLGEDHNSDLQRISDLFAAAALHDSVEDQSDKIIAKFAEDYRPFTSDNDAVKKAGALMDEYFKAKYQSTGVGELLSALTNPDFDGILAALQTDSDPILAASGRRLLKLVSAKGYLSKDVEPLLTPPTTQLTKDALVKGKNALYLGHWIELSEKHPDAFLIKLADFYSNGLHLHLFRRECFESGDEKAVKKAEKLTKKYMPVVKFLSDLFEEYSHGNEDTTVTGTRRGDKWYQGKLRSVLENVN